MLLNVIHNFFITDDKNLLFFKLKKNKMLTNNLAAKIFNI